MKRWFLPGAILALAMSTAPARAAQKSPDALTIIRKSDANLRSHTEKANFRMTLFARDASAEQVRTFENQQIQLLLIPETYEDRVPPRGSEFDFTAPTDAGIWI